MALLLHNENLPWEQAIEFCDESSCPGFIVEWATDWVSKFCREVNVREIGTMTLCVVCADSAEVEES